MVGSARRRAIAPARRLGKRPGPQGGDAGSPLTLDGEAAREALTDEQRTTTSRRRLDADPAFAEVSPDVGEVDEHALQQLLDDDPDHAMALLAEMTAATDRRLAELASRLAGRVVLERARTGRADGRGIGRLVSAPADVASGDLDIDASIDALVDARACQRPPELADLRVRRWQRPSTAIAMVVDRSGSMSGHRLATSAMAAAACVQRAPADCSVLAFGERVLVLRRQLDERPAATAVDDLLRLRGHGTTNLEAALTEAADQLAGSVAKRRVTLLLSDCRATAGAEPEAIGRRLDEVCILAPADDGADAVAFARAVGGKVELIEGPTDVPAAIDRLLG